jgi:hypothetical protein
LLNAGSQILEILLKIYQLTKGIKMKSLNRILITVFAAIFIYSCSDDTTVNNPPPPPGPFTLNGTIEPWTLGGNVKLKAELFNINPFIPPMVLDSTTVSTNGAFTLNLNDAPDSMLYPITFTYDSSCTGNVTVNPSNTKGNYNPNLSYPYGLDLYNDSMPIGFIYRSNYGPDTIFVPGWFFAYYLYLDQNVSITGSVICDSFNTTTYNFSGTRGWNKVVVLFNSFNQVTVSATEPAGGKWRVNLITKDALSGKLSLRKRMFSFNNCITCR